MTYVDLTLTPEAGYTYVNNRQVYDVVAGAMTTHPAWDYVEYVDTVSGADTYRRYVWKCNAAQSGLSADFFMVFQTKFTTATGPVTGWNTTYPVRVYMGETYSAGVLGKFATNTASVTLASDLTNPATFTLTTFAVPASIFNLTNGFGSSTSQTSLRFICLVAKDAVVLSRAIDENGSVNTQHPLYVGAYESVMNLATDPLPIVIDGTSGGAGPYYSGGTTRVPTLTPSTAYSTVFQVHNAMSGNSPGVYIGHTSQSFTPVISTVGDPASTNWYKNIGGPLVTKLALGPGPASPYNTSGIFRGFLKYVLGGSLATHSLGDTFLVNGTVHFGTGLRALVDTEAS